MHSITNFEISVINFLDVLGFLLLASEKEWRLYVFAILLVINIDCFLNLLLFRWSWYMVTAL